MQRRLGRVFILVTLVCAWAAGVAAQDGQFDSELDSSARIVRLSYVDGQVQMARGDGGGLDTAFLNSPVIGGALLTTGSDGFAETEFENGGTVRLTPNGELRFRELGLRDGNKISLLELTAGTAYFNVKQDSNDEFRVLVGGQELRVPKSARFRIRVDESGAQIAVTKGELELSGSEHNVRIRKDEQLTLDAQDPGRYFLARSIDALAYDPWDRERDDYRARYSAASYASTGYSSGYSYGATDLNYYGSYMIVAGYGNVWRPYGYDIGWDPYMDGAWVWYPGYGYTWVSGYPWGWMPYRYGRWIFIPGYGWVWQPGNQWHRWHRHSVVYNPPADYHWHRPPTQPPPHGGGGGGGGQQGVVLVGKGPYGGRPIGKPSDPQRMYHDNDKNQPVRSPGVPGGGTVVPVQHPSAVTPGVQPSGQVAEELRRRHGNDVVVPIQQRVETTVPVGGVQGNSGGAKPVQPMVEPPRPMRPTVEERVAPVQPQTVTPAPRVYQQPPVIQMPAQPQSQPQPQPHPAPVQAAPTPRPSPPTSSYRQSGGAGYGSSYAGSTRSSQSTSSGASGRSSSTSSGHSSSTSTKPSSSGHHSSNDPK